MWRECNSGIVERMTSEVTTGVDFAGHRCAQVENGSGETVVVTVDSGPRILGYRNPAGFNHLAVLPDSGLEGPKGRFHFRGGHRFWIAPEVPAITYLPDDAECSLDTTADGVMVTAPDNGSGLARSIAIRATGSGFVVDHLATNVGSESIDSVAPWAITQFPLGGTAILPFGSPNIATGPQASHALVLWEYTDPADSRLTIAQDRILIRAAEDHQPCKVGVVPGKGRLGYLRDGELFIKRADWSGGTTVDLGAASQVYTGQGFLELETLGPSVTLGPADATSHREFWSTAQVDGLNGAIDVLERP